MPLDFILKSKNNVAESSSFAATPAVALPSPFDVIPADAVPSSFVESRLSAVTFAEDLDTNHGS